MTDQIDLHKVWADSGGSSDPGDSKYSTGWVVEIPTYQNFNYVLKGLDTNLLVLAEQGVYRWQDNISYKAGTKVRVNNVFRTCITDNLNQDPLIDNTNSYWVLGDCLGGDYSNLLPQSGLLLKNLISKSDNTWGGNEQTLMNSNTVTAYLNTGLYDNWLLGNVRGEMVVVNTGNVDVPDGRLIAPDDPLVYRLYHEGNKPTIDDIDGVLTSNPLDNKLYGRYNNNWQVIKTATGATTEVGTAADEYVTPLALEESTYAKEAYVDARVFSSGVRMPFYQAAAPTGWTNLNINDYMLRVVSTNGGVTGGTDSPINWVHGHTTAGHQLTEPEMPKHYHKMLGPNSVSAPQDGVTVHGLYGGGTPDDQAWVYGTWSTGGDAASNSKGLGTSVGGTHYHGDTGLETFTPKYANVIVCSKN